MGSATYSMNDTELDSKPVRLTPYSTSAPLGNIWNARLNPLKEAGADADDQDIADPEIMVIRSEIDGRQPAKGPSANYEVGAGGVLQPGIWSSARHQQLDERKRIEYQLSRHSLACSTNTIERALMIPEDRPRIECIRNLPVPGTLLPENPMSKEEDDTVAGKKKGGKKKGGKKKRWEEEEEEMRSEAVDQATCQTTYIVT